MKELKIIDTFEPVSFPELGIDNVITEIKPGVFTNTKHTLGISNKTHQSDYEYKGIQLTINDLVKNGAVANDSISLNKMQYTNRLIVERAIARDWDVANFPTSPSIIFIHIPGRNSLIRIFSASPPNTSYPASKIAKNKYLTSRLLASAKLPVAPEIQISKDKIDSSDKEIKEFLKLHKKVVVKPLDASHGNGIVTNLVDLDSVSKAARNAIQHSQLKKILIQKQYGGHDVRVLCIGYKFCSAINRLPARVFGDGSLNIEELINKENKSTHRGKHYKTKLNIIDIEKARQYLGKQSIKRVPVVGEEVQVIGISNIGVGGERVNITNDVPKWMRQLAEFAAKVLDLPVCGVDLLVNSIPTINSKKENLQPIILEVNECPMMTMYDDLHSVEQQKIIDTYLDYLKLPQEIK